ncbi:MAG: hypothetical protein BWY25_03229 [Chloroflexi bacterium ADurb.Bin222]|nr:MAG: hypothetical protein BWY25_03229 [Chloroflexi bacterium ADurb.Bin222]
MARTQTRARIGFGSLAVALGGMLLLLLWLSLQASIPAQAAPATAFTAQDPAPFTHTLYLPLTLRDGVFLPRVSVSLTPTAWVTLQSYAETTWAEVLTGTQVFSSTVPDLCGVGRLALPGSDPIPPAYIAKRTRLAFDLATVPLTRTVGATLVFTGAAVPAGALPGAVEVYAGTIPLTPSIGALTLGTLWRAYTPTLLSAGEVSSGVLRLTLPLAALRPDLHLLLRISNEAALPTAWVYHAVDLNPAGITLELEVEEVTP